MKHIKFPFDWSAMFCPITAKEHDSYVEVNRVGGVMGKAAGGGKRENTK
jgi:hypothetical protein